MQKIKTVIVDDVQLIRAELKSMLRKYPIFDVVGEASNGKIGKKIIKALKPDVVFVDIQMPICSGFDMLNELDKNFKIIFVSSFDKYMPEAQKYNAVDFLMKPISKHKLDVALKKVIINLSVASQYSH